MLLRTYQTCLSVVRHFSIRATAEKAAQTSTAAFPTSSGGRYTLGRRLLSLVYPKRSAVIAINKWKEEGNTVRKYELNRIIRELRKLKRYKHALEICEWMTSQPDIKLQPGDYAIHLDLIAKIRGLNSAEKFFEDLPDRFRGQLTCSALLHVYVQNNLANRAEDLMLKMSECGLVKDRLPYNHMLSLYMSNGNFEKFHETIQKLKMNASPDVLTYNLWLNVCDSQNDVEGAERVFLELKKAKLDPDWFTYSTLTSLYIKNALPEKAISTLKEMESRASRKNRVAYPSLISLHANMGNKDEVFRIWKMMKSWFRNMYDAEYICMISTLVKLSEFTEAEKLYQEWESVSRTKDVRVPNILLSSYINRDQMETAENFFNQFVQKGINPCYTTWELFTRGYLKKNDVDKVLDNFKKAITSVKQWNFDQSLVREIFKMLEEQAHVEGAERLLVALRDAGHLNTEVYNLYLKTYAKASKMPLIVAERMKEDNVPLDEETHRLLGLTSKMCISDVSSIL